MLTLKIRSLVATDSLSSFLRTASKSRIPPRGARLVGAMGSRTPFARDTDGSGYGRETQVEEELSADPSGVEDIASDSDRSSSESEADSDIAAWLVEDDEEELASSDSERSSSESEADTDIDSWLAEDDEVEYEDGHDASGDVVMLAAKRGGEEGEEAGEGVFYG